MPNTRANQWISVYLPLLMTIAGTCVAWGSLLSRLSTTEKELDSVRKIVAEHEKLVVEIRTDISYARKTIDQINEQLRVRP